MPFDPTPSFDPADFLSRPPPDLEALNEANDRRWRATAVSEHRRGKTNDRRWNPEVWQDDQTGGGTITATQPAAALAVTQDSQGVSAKAAAAEVIPFQRPDASPLPSPQGDELQAVIERFNARYSVVNEGGKALVFQRSYDPILKRRRYERSTVQDMKTFFRNDMVQTGRDGDGNPVKKNAADVWLNHPNRKQYIHGVVFDPTGQQGDGVLNLWEGWGVTGKPGDWSLLKDHIRDVICSRDPIKFHYFMGWMARMVQEPAASGQVAIVMRGPRGAGKTIVADALKRITGQHGLVISNSQHLVGKFNAHLRDCVFLFCDEAFWAGDKAHIGVLNSLITADVLTVEGKGANIVQSPNFLHVMMASNETWVVPAATDERRYFVLDVPGTKLGDIPYFAAIVAQMEAGGYEAMLHELLGLDLPDFNVRTVPETEALQQQKKLSLDTTNAWWLDCLQRGYVWESKIGLAHLFRAWWSDVATDLLFKSYSEFAKGKGERRPLSREDFGRFFTSSLKAKPFRKRGVIVGEQMADVDNPSGGTSRKAEPIRQDRATGYVLGTLPEARAAFCGHTKLKFEWEDQGDD